MKCSKCSAEIPDQALFCPNCGAKAEPPAPSFNICPRCQNQLPPIAQFCNRCGAPVGQPASQTSAACAQCGTPLKADVAFCANCGMRRSGTAAQPSPYAPPYTQSYTQPRAQPYVPPYMPPVPPAPPPYYAQPAPPAKKRRGGLAAVLIIGLILIIGVGGFLLFGDKIRALFGSPKSNYINIEKKVLKQDSSDLVENLAEYSSGGVIPEKGGYNVALRMSLDEALPGVDPGTIAALENITLDTRLLFDRTGDTPAVFGKVDLLTGEEKLLTLEMLYDQDQVVVGLPDILGKYITVTKDELSSLMGTTGVDTSQASGAFDAASEMFTMDLGINESALNGTFSKIIDIMLAHVDEVEKEAGQALTAGGVTAEYDTYTMTVSKESARAMIIEILEYLKTDDEVYNLASKISSLAAASGQTTVEELTQDSYQEALDDAITDVQEDDGSEDFNLTQTIYVGKGDTVYGRELTITDGDGETLAHLFYANPVDGDEEGLSLLVESEGQSYSLAGSYTVDGEAKTGTVDLFANDSSVASLTFSDLEQKTVDGTDRLTGDMTVMVEPPADSTYTGPTSFDFKAWMEGAEYWFSVNVPGYFGVEIGYSDVPAGDVSFPSYEPGELVSVSDQEALNALMTEDAMNKLNDIVSRLGIIPQTTE